MGVELRVEVARGVVSEGRGDHLLATGANHAPGFGVLETGLDGIALDPVDCARDRPVVRFDDAPVATDERNERNRLRRRQRHVTAGAVLDIAFAIDAPELAPFAVRYLAGEHVFERLRIDFAHKAQLIRALAGPGARRLVIGIVLRVVAVALVVGDALGRRGDGADGRHHQ